MIRPPHRPDVLRRRLAGLAGAVALAAIVFGGPFLLLRLGGNPLPDSMPTIDDLAARLAGPDNGELLLWALSVVGWIGWAVMASSIMLELVAQVTGRRTPQVPGLSGPQRLAGVVVAAILAALSSPAVAAQAAYIDAAPAIHAVQTTESLPPAGQLPPAAPAEFRPGELRPGELRPGELRPGELRPGELRPAEARTNPAPAPEAAEERQLITHEVAKGDWMWHIAGRYLGDELRYPEIAELNPHYAARQPAYPDHIEPGDLLLLPADAHDHGPRPHATGDPVIKQGGTGGDVDADERAATREAPADPPPADPPAADPPPADATDPPPDDVDTDPGHTEDDPWPEPAPAQAHAAGPVTPPTHTAPPAAAPPAAPPAAAPDAGRQPASAEPPPAGQPEQDAAADDPAIAPVPRPTAGPLAAAAVLAALLVGGVTGYRRVRSAYQRRGHMVPPSEAPVEVGVGAAATADIGRLDHGLRALTVALAGVGPDALPDVGAVWLAEDAVHLILASPYSGDPPPPFVSDGARTWTLPADAPLPDIDGVNLPLPGLVTVGTAPGRHLLVDLERAGMTTVTGPRERSADLLRYLVAELAHNTWSDLVEVTLAGFARGEAEQLVALNPARIRTADSIPEAIAGLRRRLTYTTSALDRHQLADAMQGRVNGTATDTWIPQLLLIADPEPEHDPLLVELEDLLTAGGRRRAVAVVTSANDNSPYGSFPLTVTEDGQVHAGFLAQAPTLRAAALPATLLGTLSELMRETETDTGHPTDEAAKAALLADTPAVPPPPR